LTFWEPTSMPMTYVTAEQTRRSKVALRRGR
jgi:hypothetical protein